MRLIARKGKKTDGPEALDLAEEAVHLLRTLPAKAWLQYGAGSVPFLLGLLYFFADISRGAYGHRHLVPGSLMMAVLYLWLKFWQSAFAQTMSAALYGHETRPWTLRRIWNVTLLNAVVHPIGMILFPICLVLFVPLPPVYAFFHGVTFVADGEDPSLRANLARAAGLARKWYGGNLAFLFIVKLFAFLVYLNWMITLSVLPPLAGSLLGMDIARLQASDFVFNTTFQAAIIMLTWLCVSPFTRAAYALRCFYGESISSGADLKAELTFLRGARWKAALVAMILAFAAAPASTAEPSDTGPRTQQLDRRISEVLKRPEFSWRSPRQPAAEEADGLSGRMSESIGDLASRAWEKFAAGMRALVEWLFEQSEPDREVIMGDNSGGWNWGGFFNKLMWVLMAAVALALIFLGVRLWSQRPEDITLAEPLLPDLTAEDVTADELPEDEWLNLAHDLFQQGDSRLALRALYLACLAHLGERELVTISRAKSNREYQRELHRRARGMDALRDAFSENVHTFERSWYGAHEITRPMFDRFEQNLQRIRQC